MIENEKSKAIGTSGDSPELFLGSDGGDITQERLHYQNNYACLLAVLMYLGQNNFIEIWSEHLNDILCKVQDNKFVMIQVTTKVPSYPFKLNDSEIKKKISAFVHHEKKLENIISRYIIVTNCGISEQHNNLSIRELLEYYKRNKVQKTSRAEKFFRDVEIQSKLTRTDIVKVLEKLQLWHGPGIYDIESKIKDSLGNIPGIKGSISIETRDEIYLQIKKEIEDASSTSLKSVAISEPDVSLKDLLRNHKIVTKEMIGEIVDKFWNRKQIGDFERIQSEADLAKYYQVTPKDIRNIHQQLFEEAQNRFRNARMKSIFILSGQPGVGKSWFTYRLISALINEGYNPSKIRNASKFSASLDILMHKVPKSLLILDDRWISVGSRKTSIDINDVCEIIKTFLPSSAEYPPLPLVISLKRETWNQIISKLKNDHSISIESIESIVEDIGLPRLDYEDSEILVDSFSRQIGEVQPKYPFLKVSAEIKRYIVIKSQGNAAVISLFFGYVAKKAKNNEYTVRLEDVNEIVSDIVNFTLKLIFTYYFDSNDLGVVLGRITLLYLLTNRAISIGHLKTILERENTNVDSKLLSDILDNRSLALFELDDVGFLFPFHSCVMESVDLLINYQDEVRKRIPNLEKEILRMIDKIRVQCVKENVTLRQKCDKFIEQFPESSLKSLDLYQEHIEKEIKLFQTLQDITLYYYLSNLIEFLEGDEETEIQVQDFKQRYGYFIRLLQNLKISYNQDEENVTIQLFHIFRLLNLLVSPRNELKEFYLKFFNSDAKSVSSGSFPAVITMLQQGLLSRQDLVSFLPSLFKLIKSGTTVEDYLLGEIIVKLIRGGVFKNNSKGMFFELLESNSMFQRISSWAYVNGLIEMKIMTKEEAIERKKYFLDALHFESKPIIMYLAWIMVDSLLKRGILVKNDIIPYKVTLFNLICHPDDKVKNKTCYLLIILQDQRIININEDPRLPEYIGKLLAEDYLFAIHVIDTIPNWCRFPRKTINTNDKGHYKLAELGSENLHARWMKWLSTVKKLEEAEVTVDEVSEQKHFLRDMLSSEDLVVRLKSWCIVPNLMTFGIFSINELRTTVHDLTEMLSNDKNYVRYLAWFTLSRLYDFGLVKTEGLIEPVQLLSYESHIYRLPRMFPINDGYVRSHAFGLIDKYKMMIHNN